MNSSSAPTIVAIATPVGEGALAVIRLSGDSALEIADRLFRGSKKLAESAGNTVHYGKIVDAHGETIDQVLATVFREPHSFTGENAVEFSCHGGMLVTQTVLETILGSGAQQAGPGEFSRRAFLNGRMDLSQAEAVADLIAAKSDRARATSVRQLEGKLGSKVRALRTALTNLCALLELELDFSEDGLDLITRVEIERQILEVDATLGLMIESYVMGRVFREGVSVVLVGRPNVGKSSLFNTLLKERRAIVTPVPGTTRDTIEEAITIDGVLFRVTDTAGLRNTEDQVEEEGVRRTVQEARTADIVILVEDLSGSVNAEEIDRALKALLRNQHLVVALNKADLIQRKINVDQYASLSIKGARVIKTSAKTGHGLNELRRALVDSVVAGNIDPGQELVLTNQRHRDAMARARGDLQAALATLRSGKSNEFVALDVRSSVDSLGEITGEVTREDILNRVFSSFCIGK
jgi:tRNA modification GTPase